jgi:hypothetical protein
MKTFNRTLAFALAMIASLYLGTGACAAEPATVVSQPPAKEQPAPQVVLQRAALSAQELAKYQSKDARFHTIKTAGAGDNTVWWIVGGVVVVGGIILIASHHGGGGGMGGGY